MEELDKFISGIAKTLGQNYQESSFYLFAKNTLKKYESALNDNANSVERLLKQTDEMRSNSSSKIFINLIKRINIHCLYILSKAYKGDILAASSRLSSLLCVQKYTDYKLNDLYANYLKFTLAEDKKILYRCVDFESDIIPKKCNHIPFELRHLASKQRFNQIGIPCLYLSTSLECCQQEIGHDVKKGKSRWYGIFKTIKNLYFVDFTIPTEEDIRQMSDYDKFSFLVTYPLRLLCLTKTKNKGATFTEEYLFSQLFFHVVFFNEHEEFPKFDGICYTSMTDRKSLNYVLPAKYNDEEPPIEGISKSITLAVEQIEIKKISK